MRRTVVMLRSPQPGLVKTRLAADLDPEAAVGIYRVLLNRTLAVVADTDGAVELRVSPDEAISGLDLPRKPEWTVSGQGEGDLGQRLTRAFSDAFVAGATKVLVVGTDCPGLSAEDLAAAAASLDTHDVVFGPAEDGGYWLIGARALHPCLFEGMPWSTGQVYSLSRQRAQDAGLKVHALRALRDIDTLEDWRVWLRTAPL